MKRTYISIAVLMVSLCLGPEVMAQALPSENQGAVSPASAASPVQIPRLIKFSGTLLDAQERPMAGPVGVTFALYAQQTGGAALWVETQNVQPDANGTYAVLLGASSANGVPAELFTSGEARWLGIQVGQQPERERILLVSVPYALKAADAETLGGKPASAFLTTESFTSGSSSGSGTATAAGTLPKSGTAAVPKSGATTQAACASVTSDGTATVNSIGLFTTACNIQSSVLTQSGTNVGIGTAAPAVAMDIVGNNAGLRLSGTGTHQVTVTGATSGRLGQDANGFFFASDTKGSNVRFLTNNGTLNEWMRITSAGNVGIGTQTPAAKLDVNGNLNLPDTTGAPVGVISLGGKPFAHDCCSSSTITNTFVGVNSGSNFGNGNFNTALGASTLGSNGGNNNGSNNTAVGFSALGSNAGNSNVAVGYSALATNTGGGNNVGVGDFALHNNTTANNNVAAGYHALAANSTGLSNVAVGFSALSSSTGNGNIALGDCAGCLLSTGNNNVYIGNSGLTTSESGVIRIGDAQTMTFIAGISGVTTGAAAVPVMVDGNGQLGTMSSSRRFKYDIQDMGGMSDKLFQLRPVAFRYKQAQSDTSHPLQYGLIAEEVAEVYPELVQRTPTGEVTTVLYQLLPAMLLNEIQKQQSTIARLRAEIQDMAARLARLEALVAAQ